MKITVKVDAEKTSAEFKQARREINARVKTGSTTAGRRAILPHVRIVSPGIVRSSFAVKATTRGAYLTTVGPRKYDRITGLLNYGGTVWTQIKPVKKQALTIGPGIVRARVNKPRKYRGRKFIERGIARGYPEYERTLLTEVMRAFDPIEHTP